MRSIRVGFLRYCIAPVQVLLPLVNRAIDDRAQGDDEPAPLRLPRSSLSDAALRLNGSENRRALLGPDVGAARERGVHAPPQRQPRADGAQFPRPGGGGAGGPLSGGGPLRGARQGSHADRPQHGQHRAPPRPAPLRAAAERSLPAAQVKAGEELLALADELKLPIIANDFQRCAPPPCKPRPPAPMMTNMIRDLT
eukprot:COSAG04_NODE_1511_length_6492_cov_2.089786_5_plen_196_part_00